MSSPFLDFVEIGTCDFHTEIENADDQTRGMSIEPLPLYLDRLPNRANVKKVNVAISDSEGTCTIHYVDPERIKRSGMPFYIRGCNSMDRPHPTTLTDLDRAGLAVEENLSTHVAPKKRLSTVFAEHGVQGLFYLKIDTEGHDCVILKDLANTAPNSFLPHVIRFESNVLTPPSLVRETIDMLSARGYVIKGQTADDTEMRLDLARVKKSGDFTPPIAGYHIENASSIENYDVDDPPHANTLLAAMNFCKDNSHTAVVYLEGDRYRVLDGRHVAKNGSTHQQKQTMWLLL